VVEVVEVVAEKVEAVVAEEAPAKEEKKED
jgi:hypothetical protein